MDRPENHGTNAPSLIANPDALEAFHDDVKYLWTNQGTIPVYDEPPSPLYFLRHHVAASRPCIIRNAISDADEQPLQVSLDDLVEQFPGLKLQVDVTPDGHGDCLRAVQTASDDSRTRKAFVKPMEMEMTIADFRRHLRTGRHKQQEKELPRSSLDAIRKRKFALTDPLSVISEERNDNLDIATQQQPTQQVLDNSVLYYSRQMDCLRQELAPLWNMTRDEAYFGANSPKFVFPRSFDWAEQAFSGSNSGNHNTGPDAVNLWMGDERAVSAMHKDHYENLFYVLSGEKVFSLCPPADAPFLYEQDIISGCFQTQRGNQDDDQEWCVSLDKERVEPGHSNDTESHRYSKVHWIASDPFGNRDEQKDEFPLLQYTHPIPTVRVKAGELLYLPSLWFHRVTQTCETVGINYWYDMSFESPLWCYFHFLQQLKSESTSRG